MNRRVSIWREAGSKTESNRADRERISVVLNNVLATEIVCALRYKKAFLHGS